MKSQTAGPADAQREHPRPPQQPLEAVLIPGAQLKLATVVALSGVSKSSVWRAVKAGELAAPVKHGARCSRWRASDVKAWLEYRSGMPVFRQVSP